MRPSRIFRWIVRLFLLVFTLSLSGVSLLGGFSAVTILDPDSYNVNIPDGPIVANLDITNKATMSISVPFNITNVGVYDLDEIIIGFQIGLIYGNTSTPLNDTTNVKIFDKTENYGSVLHGQVLKDTFSGLGTDGFIFANIPDPSDVDRFRDPDLVFHANFTFSAMYSLRLYKFTVNLINYSLGQFEIPYIP
jgi:hypothetical protein